MLAYFSVSPPRGVAKDEGRDDADRNTSPFASGTATRLHPLVETDQSENRHDHHYGEDACRLRMSANPLRDFIFIRIRNWRHDFKRTKFNPFRKYTLVFAALLSLSACATARLHSQAELNGIGQQCGLALGELFQDESEKRLVFLFRPDVTPEQRRCVTQWARKNRMKTVIVEGVTFPQS